MVYVRQIHIPLDQCGLARDWTIRDVTTPPPGLPTLSHPHLTLRKPTLPCSLPHSVLKKDKANFSYL